MGPLPGIGVGPAISTLAEVVSQPNGAGRHEVAAELIGETRGVVNVKLRADEYVVGNKERYTNSRMYLKVIRSSHRQN